MKKTFLYILLMVITATVFGQNVYVVTKTTDPNPFTDPYKFNDADCDPDMLGTLQWAINKSNDDNAESVIKFNIPGNGPHEIVLNSYLPQIKQPVTINAETQAGYIVGTPAIIINGQNKFNSGIDSYYATTRIFGLNIKNFINHGVLLSGSNNSEVRNCVITSIVNNNDYKTPAIGVRIVGCNNVSVYGNNIQTKLNSPGSLAPTYGVFIDKSFYCVIGGTNQGQANIIANCGNTGVAVRGCDYNKISGNSIYLNDRAIEMIYNANGGIQPPVITSYTNGILSGTALPNSTVEVFGSTGAENANEYLVSVVADGNGEWSVELTTSFERCISTQIINNNSSILSNNITMDNCLPCSNSIVLNENVENEFQYFEITNQNTWFTFIATDISYSLNIYNQNHSLESQINSISLFENTCNDLDTIYHTSNVDSANFIFENLIQNTRYYINIIFNENCDDAIFVDFIANKNYRALSCPLECPDIVRNGDMEIVAVGVTNGTNCPFLINYVCGWFRCWGTPQIYNAGGCEGDKFARMFSRNRTGGHSGPGIYGEGIKTNIDIIPGETYTLSFCYKQEIGSNIANLDQICIALAPLGAYTVQNISGTTYSDHLIPQLNNSYEQVINSPIPNTWQEYSHTFTPTIEYRSLLIYPKQYAYSVGWLDIDNVKIVKLNAEPNEIYNESYCIDNGLVDLDEPEPQGQWSGEGIIDILNGIFDPNLAGVGSHTLTYSIGYECDEYYLFNISVYSIPDATIYPVGQLCTSDDPIHLSAVSMGGGVWSGNGITDELSGEFDPLIAGVGTHIINYFIYNGPCYDEATTTIIVTQPEVTILPIELTCIGDDVTITANSEDNVTYSWSGPGGFQSSNSTFSLTNINNGMLGTYTVVVTDENNCTNQATITVGSLPVPIVNITPDPAVICNNAPIILNAGVWASYHWNNDEETQTIVADVQNATYSVVVTDDNGCTGSDEVTTVPSNLTIKNPIVTGTCDGENSGSITFIIDGENPPYDVVWTSDVSFSLTQLDIVNENYELLNLFAGTYFVTVRDDIGCEVSATFVVEASFIAITTTNSNPVLCIDGGESSIISVEAADGIEPYTYSWNNGLGGANTHTVSPNVTTTYIVTVTDAISCTETAEITVTVIDLVLIIKHPERSICLGESTPLDATAEGVDVSYSWSPTASLDNPNSQFPIATPTETTLYTVTATDINGCSTTGTVLVTVFPLPVITVSYPAETCAGYEEQLEAFGAITYLWEPATGLSNPTISNPIAVLSETTTYIVSGWDEHGCKGFTEITINVLDNPVPIIDYDDPVCLDGNLEINITNIDANSHYHWEGPDGFTTDHPNIVINNVTNLNQGLYSVTVTHGNGCTATNSIYVTVHSFEAYIGSNHPCVGEDLELVARPDGMVSYHWEGENNLNETTNINQLIIPNADLSMAGTYYVTITDQYGCTASAQTTVVVHDNPIVNLGDDILICLSESLMLGQNLTITGGSPSYSYEWEPIDWLSDPMIANPIATPQATTTYTLTVSDTYACTGSDAITITVDQIIGLIATYNESVCQYTQLQLFAQPDGLEYQWTGPAGFTSTEQNPIVTDVANANYSGTYILTASNANTCISSVSLDVVVHPVPDVFTGAPQTICEGDELTLQGGPNGMQEYHWIGPNGFLSNLQNPTVSITANTNMQGNYTLTTISEFGCSASATTFVEVIPTPQNAQFALPCVYIFNEYTFTNLGNNNPSFIYSWDFGDGIVSSDANPIHEFQNEGYHCLTLTVSNQCGISTYSPEPIFLYPNACACITEYDVEDDLQITGSNEYWNPAYSSVKKDIIIESGAKLTVDGQTIQFGPEGRVIVKQGGELFITNFSTLRGLESCENMWQGVEVWGDYDSQATDVVQGKVIIGKQDNIIQDAHIGILVGARNMDNLCEFNIEQAFINEFAGGFVQNNERFLLKNDGIGIKVLRKHNSAMSTWANYGLRNTQFLSEDVGLTDVNYNSVLGPNPYPNRHNKWAGNANSLQRTDAGIWMDNVKITQIGQCKFANVQYGILAYNSYFNVFKTDFDNAVYGIRIENLNSSINTGHEIVGCKFTNIKGTGDDDFEDITSAGIFINSSLNAKIHGNVFGVDNSLQQNNNKGIFTLNALSMNIYQNNFYSLDNGIFTANLIFTSMFPLQIQTNLPTNYIGAGVNSNFDVTTNIANWQGNIFTDCKTSIYTYLVNSNLRLKCNVCNNSLSDGEYFTNFYNEGWMANIGAAPTTFHVWLNIKRAAGNEFTPDNVAYYGYYKTLWSNTAYEYFAHSGPLKVIPVSEASSPTNMTSHIHTSAVEKPASFVAACAPAFVVGPVLENVEVLPTLGFANAPYKKLDEYKVSIDSLNSIADNIKQNIDGGNTQQLLNAIYGNMASGRLKNLLIENSPLSDTVIYALLTDYPLANGDFKNVMQINLPVSKEYAQLFFDVMEQIPAGIANQLITLQGANPGINTICSIQRETEYLWLERGQLLNNLLNMLTDSINNNRDDAMLILEKENSLWANATLAASYFEDGDYLASREKISLLQSDDPLVNDFIDYQNLMLDVYEDGRSIYQLDSTEISFIRNLAYKCPAGIASFNCQAILSQLYRENVPICPVSSETRMNAIPQVNYLQTENYNRTENEISLGENYPDPASDYTNISYFIPDEKEAVFVVYDAVGKLIYKSDANTGENQITLDTHNLLPGVYTYSLSTKDGETITKKMIVYR